jgi:hypothetical protein
LKIGVAFFTAASNSASKPGLTSICAISVIILVFTPSSQCPHPITTGGAAKRQSAVAHRADQAGSLKLAASS